MLKIHLHYLFGQAYFKILVEPLGINILYLIYKIVDKCRKQGHTDYKRNAEYRCRYMLLSFTAADYCGDLIYKIF